MESCIFTPENAETLANMLSVLLVGNVFIGAFVATIVVNAAFAFVEWRQTRKAQEAA